jgi:hypothetical protein
MNKKELIKTLKECRHKDDLAGNYIKTLALKNHDYLKYSGNVRLDSIINIINKDYNFKIVKNSNLELILYLKALDLQEYIITILKDNRIF